MWDLPGPGLEPVSPALADGFLTTVPPGKSESTVFIAGPSKEYGWPILKRPKLPDGFQGRVFKGNIWGKGCGVYDFLLIGWW